MPSPADLKVDAILPLEQDLPVIEQAELWAAFSNAAGAIERNEECVAAATRARERWS